MPPPLTPARNPAPLRWLAPGLGLVALACGRSDLFDLPGADAGRADAGVDAGHDAGPPPDAGPRPIPCDHDGGFGAFTGSTPLGSVDFRFVWTGLEPFGSHSCPHVTVHFAPSAARSAQESFTAEFLFDRDAGFPGFYDGNGELALGGKTIKVDLRAYITKVDGLRGTGLPVEQWKVALSFPVARPGWSAAGVVADAPVCAYGTWLCL